jgi:energy-converting hydrogenase B subunit Q
VGEERHPVASGKLALLIQGEDQPGVLYQLTRVIASHQANITTIDIIGKLLGSASVYLELQDVVDSAQLVNDLNALPVVKSVEPMDTFQKIYGKRVIIIGGGAQVGQVALGAISEADRHNIRGERISVDTIPLVGEADLSAAVRAVARLPRAKALVMAGALMGGEISKAVAEVREKGILVLSLNMAGSVPDAADLVVSDPVQAGVMAVMAIADTAKFDLRRQQNRRY